MTDTTRGRFLWYELLTTDVEAAKAFYSEVVGWRVEPWTELAEPYPVLMAGEQGVGGLQALPQGNGEQAPPPHWLAYVGTPDVDGTVARLTALGGEVLAGPLDIPQVGRIAVFRDPQGAAIACFAPAGTGESEEACGEPEAGPGRFSWNELYAADAEAAFGFYAELFGWAKHEAMDMGEAGVYQMYGLPGETTSFGGMMNVSPEMPQPPCWNHYIRVTDLDGSLGRVTKLGGQIFHGPIEVPGGDRVAVCADPQGAMFSLHGGPEKA